MNEMRAWLLAQLSFDPHRNGTALLLEFLDGFYGEKAAPFVLRHMEVWRDAVMDSKPPGGCHDIIDARLCPRKLTKYDTPQAAPWVTPAAILRSSAALTTALTAAQGSAEAAEFRPQLDRLWITTRYLLLWRWNTTCAQARQTGAAWPVAPLFSDALRDLEGSLKAAEMLHIAPGKPASWLRNGSGLNLSQRCDAKEWI